jgi:predicted acylesterase/phospholipase RssA
MNGSAEVRALVLSGGGAKGAYEVGLISKLMEFEEPFDIVCGTSIGALNAAMIAQHRIPELVEIWQKISVLDVMKPSPHVEPWHELFQRAMAAKNANWLAKGPKVLALLAYVLVHGHKLTSRSSLASITGVIDHLVTQSILEEYLDFSQLKSVLMTSACNLTLRREDAFYYFPPEYARFERTFLNQQAREHRKPIPYNPELFYEFVRASGAIPCAFTPVQLTTELDVLDDGKHTVYHYVDGAVTDNTPISSAIDAGARDITIVYVDPASPSEPQAVDNLAEIMLGCLSVMRQRMLDLDYQTALRVNDAKAAGAENAVQKHRVRLRKFRPEQPLSANLIGFNDSADITAAFEIGQADASSAEKRGAYVDHSPDFR